MKNRHSHESISESQPRNLHIHNQDGFNYMKTQKVIIAGLIRDREDRVYDFSKQLEYIGQFFLDYRVLVVENDSQDGTRKLLTQWAHQNKKVHILGCDNDELSCKLNLPRTLDHLPHRDRIAKMAYLRNIYLEYLREHYSDFDYLLVIDLDIQGNLYMDGIANTFTYFSQYPDIGAIGANGIRLIDGNWIYYDAFPYIEIGEPFEWSTMEQYLQHDHKVYSKPPRNYGEPLHPVRSCFAGAVFYRLSKMSSSARYDYSKTGYACEHVYFNLNFQMYLNPSMIYHVIDH